MKEPVRPRASGCSEPLLMPPTPPAMRRASRLEVRFRNRNIVVGWARPKTARCGWRGSLRFHDLKIISSASRVFQRVSPTAARFDHRPVALQAAAGDAEIQPPAGELTSIATRWLLGVDG